MSIYIYIWTVSNPDVTLLSLIDVNCNMRLSLSIDNEYLLLSLSF
jgi:hypothetical protein